MSHAGELFAHPLWIKKHNKHGWGELYYPSELPLDALRTVYTCEWFELSQKRRIVTARLSKLKN
jgi:hypothetical protein